ncbi:prepilin-type N-terminal cleavage/methylation domain-containing protein [Burkholderia glumae]
MKKQKGFTAIEVLFVIASLASIAVGVGVLYAIVHFISKFW